MRVLSLLTTVACVLAGLMIAAGTGPAGSPPLPSPTEKKLYGKWQLELPDSSGIKIHFIFQQDRTVKLMAQMDGKVKEEATGTYRVLASKDSTDKKEDLEIIYTSEKGNKVRDQIESLGGSKLVVRSAAGKLTTFKKVE